MNFKYFKTVSLIPLLLVLAFVLRPLSNFIEENAKAHGLDELVGYVDALSTIGLLTIVLTFINYIGWKWKVFQFLIDMPNLNGRFEGKLISSFLDEEGNPIVRDCAMEIRQTASSPHIYSYYGSISACLQTSSSKTMLEHLIKEHSGFFTLYYVYSNEPGPLINTLVNHDGTAKFAYHADIRTIVGEYYNKRSNTGTFQLSFVQKKRIGRLVREL